MLVGAVIEKVTGKPWHVNVDERIARPLGLKTIRYGVLEGETPNMAKGLYAQTTIRLPRRPEIHMSVPHAAGALIGSVEDLAKWNAALHSRQDHSPRALCEDDRADRDAGRDRPRITAYGIAPREVRSRKALGHGGGIFGFSTDSIYLPKEDIFVAVFTNSDLPAAEPGLVMQQLAALAIDDPFPTFQKAALDAKSVEPWVGLYKVKDGERRVFLTDGKLFTQRTGGGELEAFAGRQWQYFYHEQPDLVRAQARRRRGRRSSPCTSRAP